MRDWAISIRRRYFSALSSFSPSRGSSTAAWILSQTGWASAAVLASYSGHENAKIGACWEICARAGLSDVRWFSSPSAIIARFGGECWHGSLLRDGAITLDEIALGFLTGTFGGILFGLMLVFMPRLRRILMPYLQ